METSEMIRSILLLAAETTARAAAESEFPVSTLLFFWVLNGAGLLLLLGWLVRKWGADPLTRAPVRRNRLPVWFGLTQVLVWMVGTLLLQLIIDVLYKNAESWRFQLVSGLAVIIWYGILLTVFLSAARTGFARGLKGFGLRPRRIGRDLAFAAVAILAIMPLIYGTMMSVLWVVHLFKPEFVMEQHASLTALGDFPQWWMRAVIVFSALLAAPVFEEVLFRGLLQSTLTVHLQWPWLSILVTSVFFALLHPYPTHWLPLFILSVALGYTYEKSGSLWQPIFMHILFNGLSIVYTLLEA